MQARAKAGLAMVALLGCAAASMAHAQAQANPDQKKLDYFVGKWRSDVDIKATANSQAAKVSGTEVCEWFANTHIVCHSDSTGPTGPYKAMRILSYVPTMKQFASYTIDSAGYVSLAIGEVQGPTWTFTANFGGLKTRYVMKTTKDGYSAVSEYAGADGKWVTVSAVNATRAK